MNILMSCNGNYFLPTLVTMYSVLKNNPCRITFYILHSSLTAEQIDRMRALAEESGHGTVEPVLVSPNKFAGKNSGLNYLSQEAYYRLLAQKLLPETVDRFLWLDSDIVVLGNIEDFYNQDFEGMLICACSYKKEGEISNSMPQYTLPKDTRYFNSGVYLADLAAQRKCIDPDIYETYLRVFEKRLRFADQDILNAVFYCRVKYADEHVYNLVVEWLEKITTDRQREIRKSCKILHYNGEYGKPWLATYSYLWGDIFWKYAENLPEYAGKYALVRPEQKKSRAKYLRRKKKYIAEQKRKQQEKEQEYETKK